MAGNTYDALAVGAYRAPRAKTAAYAVVPDDIAAIFTNRGATGSVTFTLPPIASVPAGWFCEFFAVADYAIVISGEDESFVTFNDASADSVALSTSGEIMGGSAKVISDGTSWLVQLMVNETQTPVIASA